MAGFGGFGGGDGGGMYSGSIANQREWFKSKEKQAPWGPQQPFLSDVWDNSRAVYERYSPQAAQLGGQYQAYGQMLMPSLGSALNYWDNAMNGNPELLASIMRDPYRAFTEQEIPGIRSHAIANGTLGGSRSQISEAIAERGFYDRATDLAAQLRDQSANSLFSAGQYGAQLGQSGLMLPMDLLQRYSNMVQAGQWGGVTSHRGHVGTNNTSFSMG